MFTLLFMFLLYFFPSIIAAHRDHPNRTGILILNTFLGFTVVGWFVALIWALSCRNSIVYVPYQGYVVRR